MATPHPPVYECLEKCQTLLEKGDELLSINPRTTTTAQSALESYIAAFKAIHVLIKGRTRRVLAEGYFDEEITQGRFAGPGRMGSAIRLILDIRLVSRCVLCYLRLGEIGEAAFWGLGSVRLIVRLMGDEISGDEMLNDFDFFIADTGGASDVGLVNARTAMAFALLERSARDDEEGGEGGSGRGASPNGRREKWRQELRCYEGDGLARSHILWEFAGMYLRVLEQEEARKVVTEEAKEFGIEIPEGTLAKKKDGSDVDSLSLAGVGE